MDLSHLPCTISVNLEMVILVTNDVILRTCSLGRLLLETFLSGIQLFEAHGPQSSPIYNFSEFGDGHSCYKRRTCSLGRLLLERFLSGIQLFEAHGPQSSPMYNPSEFEDGQSLLQILRTT